MDNALILRSSILKNVKLSYRMVTLHVLDRLFENIQIKNTF